MTELQRDPLAGFVGAIDTKHEEEGEWYEHAPEEGIAGPNQIEGFRHKLIDANGNGLKRIKVCSRHIKAYQDEEDALGLRVLRLPKGKRAAKTRANNNHLAGKYALTDWECTNADGNVVPFERKLGIRLMTEPQFRYQRAFVYEGIARIEGIEEEAREEDEGN